MTDATPAAAVPLFIADHLALDFINTASGTGPNHSECLGSDQQVLEWLTRAGAIFPHQLPPAAGKRGTLLKAALQLRENARELLERRKAGKAGDASALNALLASGSTHHELIWKKGHPPTIRQLRSGSGDEATLVPVAEAIAKLLVEGDFHLIRKCESDDCTLWFLDRTKSHRRRWCSMAVCGNRAKVAAFRERQKE